MPSRTCPTGHALAPATAACYTASMSDQAPPWPPIGGPLDDVNDDFHRSYDAARAVAEDAAPVLIVLGDVLSLHRRGARDEVVIAPRLFHALKSVCHAPLAVYAALYLAGDRPLEPAATGALHRARDHVRAALAALTIDLADPEVLADARPLLASTLEFVERILGAGRTSRPDLAAFAGKCGPALLRLTDHATALELAALHAGAERLLAPLTAAEQGALQVVVAGSHQARERSLAMQYFRKRLREPDRAEERVTYAENAADEHAALMLVGTRRLDRAIAGAFFGDPKRLQRDVFGDSAAARLATWDTDATDPR
jgi:hypothetical protein